LPLSAPKKHYRAVCSRFWPVSHFVRQRTTGQIIRPQASHAMPNSWHQAKGYKNSHTVTHVCFTRICGYEKIQKSHPSHVQILLESTYRALIVSDLFNGPNGSGQTSQILVLCYQKSTSVRCSPGPLNNLKALETHQKTFEEPLPKYLSLSSPWYSQDL
jgi:hypothetical protein